VSKYDKLLVQVLRGTSDANISFDGFRELLRQLGFVERVRGSHHIFSRECVEEIQPGVCRRNLELATAGHESQSLPGQTSA